MTVREISTALNFIVGSIEYYYQQGIADEETRNALKEAFANFHKLDVIIRERAQPINWWIGKN
jgi:valyl-tRNA synthetase